jgi:hypothetical protein
LFVQKVRELRAFLRRKPWFWYRAGIVEFSFCQAQMIQLRFGAGILLRDNMSRKDGGNALPYPAPVVRIGFMGRSDRAEPGIGRGLISDAARRVYRNPDIAAWGLVLESEDGPQNKKLWEWYQKQGFKPCRQTENTMYGPLSAFLPELQPVEN